MNPEYDFIKPNTVGFTIYSKSNCPFCNKVQELLKDRFVSTVKCDKYLDDREKFLLNMSKLTGKDYSLIRLSFPVVFYEDIFIGGYNDTVEYLNTNVENNRFGV